ncbi:hypothetical protein Z517_09297 [Fonsecaea pedrosoi CBS 271.37]|uniref:Uncharacterized protein n=1 Tax=Fonsecaea pedrosoi CBS 271.37 TaxID=1442368 RepID=A0A0D2G838_9EURO|nr:uncharacterized protein Z517_09297 [Fonsecaea pedrosoi CBS 271.37]KIW76853.1 hypothetical protein Z517_09297 [Fonsecaea pedrosoi CBS 271.37]
MQRPMFPFPERQNTPPGLGGHSGPRVEIETPNTPPVDDGERVTQLFVRAQQLLDCSNLLCSAVPNLEMMDAIMHRLEEMDNAQRTQKLRLDSLEALSQRLSSLREDLAKAIAERDAAKRELAYVTAYSLRLKQEVEKYKSGAEDSNQVNAEQEAGNPGSSRSPFGRR